MKLKLTYLLLIIIAIICGYMLGIWLVTFDNPIIKWFGTNFTLDLAPTNIHFTAVTLTIGFNCILNPAMILLILIAIAAAPKVAASIK
ncbi:MAG: hypothetical protein MJ065_08110 [Oscillospiraceae bacterium]|nr:hypothetical protein [Oscillospiraceae bacterium]